MKTLKIGDEVKVISGDNKGKTAKIVAIDREGRKASLEGINVIERHVSRSQYRQAGKKTVHPGIDWSNLKLVKEAKFEKKSSKKSDKKDAKKKGAK